MFRKPGFWIAFTIISLLCVWISFHYAPRAFSLMTLDLEMDREAALAQAAALAEKHGWGPEGFRQVASFELDFDLQAFVELEGGGKEAFTSMLSEGLVSPYTWRVRNFKEFETTESTVLFTPTGEPYGFVQRLPEDQPGAALVVGEAQIIAEAGAVEDWGVDLGDYELVEESQEFRPGGRLDHSFVYERPSPIVGEEGRYRLRLVVSGDRFTELSHYLKVPEAFARRFEEMRSANLAIGVGSNVAMAVLYLIGGCLVGLFMLLRMRWVVWKPAVKWAVFISILQALVIFNQWPLLWTGYDTAVSSTNFALQQLALVLAQFFGMGIVLAASFMAAESLGRKAFPQHIQFWKSWSPQVAGTRDMAGLTTAGFLLVSIFLAYDVFLYALANDLLGWWSPASPLVNPNTLATYFPWLTSVAISLQAGFWEECLFRAVPLACAALIGRRFGGTRYWIIGVLVLQALIFGAGHAPYPQQPSYARVVELILPAIAYGLIYLAFGLIPVIVCHFAFDVALISLPLFASSSEGIWFDRSIVILLTLVPLWMVFRGRLKLGRWGDVEENDRNAAWQPPEVQPAAEAPVAAPTTAGLIGRLRTAVLAAGVVGLVVWGVTAEFRSDAPPIEVGRGEVLAAARQELGDRGVELGEEWRELSTVVGGVGLADRFVWQEGGEDAYQELLGSSLRPPEWSVRQARFEGDVAERAEEYGLWYGGDGKLTRYRHQLAEGEAGAELSVDEARAKAFDVLERIHGLDPTTLEEISAEPEQQPDRRDWKLVYSDPSGYPLEQGEARIAVFIGGDEVVDSYRFVHVPEEWERQERNRSTMSQVIEILCTIVVVLVFVAAAITSVVRWSRGRFAPGAFGAFAGLLLVVGLIEAANQWPTVAASFSTAQDFSLQAGITVPVLIVMLIVISVAIAMAIGFVHRWLPPQPAGDRATSIAAGAALGGLAAGLVALGAAVSPASQPEFGPFQMAGTVVPVLGAALDPISSFVTTATLLLIVFGFVHSLSGGWTRRRVLLGALVVVFGIVMAGSSGVSTVAQWLGSGVAAGLMLIAAYVVVLRFHLALIPVAAGAVAALGALRTGVMGMFPGALIGGLIAAVLVAALSVYWYSRLTRDTTVVR
jgi:hypothetical protein